MRVKGVILSLVSLGLIGAGTVLIVMFLLDPDVLGNLSSGESQGFNVPVLVQAEKEV